MSCLFIMFLAFTGVGKEADFALGVNDHDAFDRMALFLATVILFLSSVIYGARDGPFRSIVKVDFQSLLLWFTGVCVPGG